MGAEVAAALLCYRVPTFLQSSSDFPLKVSRAIFFERDRSLALKRAGSPSLASAGVEVSEASSLSNRIIRALSKYQSSPLSPEIGIAGSSCSGAIRLSSTSADRRSPPSPSRGHSGIDRSLPQSGAAAAGRREVAPVIVSGSGSRYSEGAAGAVDRRLRSGRRRTRVGGGRQTLLGICCGSLLSAAQSDRQWMSVHLCYALAS